MTKLLKVTVYGFVDEVFVGTDKQVEAYLLDLKKKQESEYEQEDLKWYKKEMPTYRNSFIFTKSEKKAWHSKYDELSIKYFNPSSKMEYFREKQKPKGLTIKIEKIEQKLIDMKLTFSGETVNAGKE